MKLGEYQELYYVKKVDFGVYLAEDLTSETHVLLPAKQVPENAKTGEKIRVFLYKDSKDRLIATTNTPEAYTRRLRTTCCERSGKNRCVS